MPEQKLIGKNSSREYIFSKKYLGYVEPDFCMPTQNFNPKYDIFSRKIRK